jgi:hypothetical protein
VQRQIIRHLRFWHLPMILTARQEGTQRRAGRGECHSGLRTLTEWKKPHILDTLAAADAGRFELKAQWMK